MITDKMKRTALLFATFGHCALAAEHSVSTAAEVTAAAKIAAPGDTIVMKDGTWPDAKIIFEAAGTEDKVITLRAENPGRVIITGASVLRVSGKYLVIDGLRFERCSSGEDLLELRTHSRRHATHTRVTNCAFVDSAPSEANTDNRWISIYGANNRLDHCYLAGKANRGATVVVWLQNEPVQHRIDHNHFGPRPRLKVNGGETIRVGDSKTAEVPARCRVESNVFEECNGEVEIVSNKSSENVYSGNVFRRCEGALTLRHGHACIVENNLFLGENMPRTGGVRITDADHVVRKNGFYNLTGEGTRAALCLMNGVLNSKPHEYYTVRRATIEANTFVNCRQTLVLGYAGEGGTVPPEACRFTRNEVFSPHVPHVRSATALPDAQWIDNLMTTDAHAAPAPPEYLEPMGPYWRQPR